jgi:hypothetical protein
MHPHRILALALFPALLLSAHAQEKKADPKKPKPDPKVWMCKRGELLWEEKFEDGKYSKEWNKYKGNFVVEGDAVKSAEVAADGHHPAMSRKLGGDNNVIIQFSFKVDGAPWMGFALDDKEHVARLILNPDQFKIVKMSGIGGTTKGVDVDVRRTKLNDGTWHTVVWEIYGEEMVATIDDQQMVIGKAEGLTPTRSRCELINGGQWAWYREIRVWKAELDEKWPQKRAQILQMLKKKAEPTAK